MNSSLMGEGSFFELLRSVLGNIKTPFSKQKLLNDLAALLLRNDIQKVIKAYIDEVDHKIIAAVVLLNDPVSRDIEEFFFGEFTGAELSAFLINLEERFILYRYKHEESMHLALNPVLKQVLAPFIAETSPLLPSFETTEASVTTGSAMSGIPDNRSLAALFAFILATGDIIIADRAANYPKVRRKAIDAGKKIFPEMDFEVVLGILLCLELCHFEGGKVVLCREKIADFAELSLFERQEYWIAAMYICLNEPEARKDFFSDEDTSFPGRRKLRLIASSIHRFRALVESGKSYPDITLYRLWKLLEINDSTDNSGVKPHLNDLLSIMEKTGLLEKKGDRWASRLTDHYTEKNKDNQEPVIVMDSAFSIVLLPEISFTDALMLGTFCLVKECIGSSVSFELTRSSTVRGFDQGIEAKDILELLERLSGNRLDANISWTIKEWESRYAEVSLHQGIILYLAEDRRYLAEANPVKSLIRKTLAPGAYLLSSSDRAEAVKALNKAGIDIIAQPPSLVESSRGRADNYAFSLGYTRKSFPRLHSTSISPIKADSVITLENDASISIREDLRKALDKMPLAKHERDELRARIERRLVLSKVQLEAKSLRYEKLEARGLDYAGKSLIARQSLEAGSLVEVCWPNPDGELNRIVGIPQSLEKKDGDSIFVFRTGNDTVNDTRVFKIPLRKISLLRRIKQSLFKE